MDRSVVTAMLSDREAAFVIAGWMENGDLDSAVGAVARATSFREVRPITAAIVLDPDHPPILVEGFLVQALLAVLEDEPDAANEASGLIEAVLRRIAVPRRNSFAYVEALGEGTVLLAMQTPAGQVEQTCGSLEAAGACATSIHIHHCFAKNSGERSPCS